MTSALRTMQRAIKPIFAARANLDETSSPRAWAFEGVLQALSGPAFYVAIALMGVGGLARAAGFPPGAAIASTLLVWAGPGQLLFFGCFDGKTALSAAAFSIWLSSIRFLPMCLSVLPMLKTKKTRTITLMIAAHFIAVTVWAESLRRLPDVPKEKRMPFFFGFSLCCISIAAAFTGAGYFLAQELPTPLSVGMLFLPPLYFLATTVRGASAPLDYLALALGLALAPFTQLFIGGGFDLVFLGLFGGGSAYLIDRSIRSRKARAI